MNKTIIAVRKELNITWRFIKNDIWATIIPGLIMTFVALYHSGLPIQDWLILALEAFFYFLLYVYTFVLTNQLNSEKEDLINKPFRPLPSKLVNPKGVIIRYVMSVVIFLVFATLNNVGRWALLWILVSLFHNTFGHKHWFTKNVISMSFGIFAIIGAAWEIVLPINYTVVSWGMVVSVILGSCGVIQDFRDVAGDKVLDRKTLPLDMGDKKARTASVFICIVSYILLSITILVPAGNNAENIIFSLLTGLLFGLISIRILLFRRAKDDHSTYMILLYLFNLILLSGLIYL